uniref:Tudor domain-containing protein n=1 Tax=Steinernema glaseri TaxID=37863 RepID=A0A1I7Y6H6_9BILA
MDSVPSDFCLDVLGFRDVHPWDYEELAKALSGRWKAAADSLADNIQDLTLHCRVENGEWSYASRIYRRNNENRANQDDLPTDRRFLRCKGITFNAVKEDEEYIYEPCSKEEILDLVVPGMLLQMRRSSCIDFGSTLSPEDASLIFDSFLRWHAFGLHLLSLWLPYYGPESERFLSTFLDRGGNLGSLILNSSWPHSESVEGLVVKFLNSSDPFVFVVDWTPKEFKSEPSLTLTPKILEVILNAWDTVEDFNIFFASTPWHAGPEEVLLLPVPPNATRKLLKAEDASKEFIVWSKEDGSTLSCTIDYSKQRTSLNVPSDESVHDPTNIELVSPP